MGHGKDNKLVTSCEMGWPGPRRGQAAARVGTRSPTGPGSAATSVAHACCRHLKPVLAARSWFDLAGEKYIYHEATCEFQ